MRKDFENHESSEKPLWNKKLVWENIEANIHEDEGKPIVFLWFKLATACAIVILGLAFFGEQTLKTIPDSMVNKAHKEVIKYKSDTVLKIVSTTKYVFQNQIVRDTILSEPVTLFIHDTVTQIKEIFAEQKVSYPNENQSRDTFLAAKQNAQIKYSFNEPIGAFFPKTKIRFKFLNKENSSGGNSSKDVFMVLSR